MGIKYDKDRAEINKIYLNQIISQYLIGGKNEHCKILDWVISCYKDEIM
jgi:hypothetical protein